VCQERLSPLASPIRDDLIRRSRDWSEIRPEWGLAGNVAFIAAPRELTRSVPLHGRSFLHSYDHRSDRDFAVLEQIMTAPLVVANWINMQYYASTVDPALFGSGNKTVHNVVGQFGLFSGNGGDLMTGLPWQSVHDGHGYQHHPLRLLAVIAAPRLAIETVVGKHEPVANLVTNGWVQLLAAEASGFYRYTARGTWEQLTTAGKQQAADLVRLAAEHEAPSLEVGLREASNRTSSVDAALASSLRHSGSPADQYSRPAGSDGKGDRDRWGAGSCSGRTERPVVDP